ncbi:DUF4388 domain-containing protein [Thermovibrio sp.]
MELKGHFKSYAEILDLFQIISMGRKSGEVNLKSESGDNIILTFKEGKIIDFLSSLFVLVELKNRVIKGELPLEEALNFLLHFVSLWEEGNFRFVEKPVDVEGIGSADALNVMMNFTKEEDETPPEVRSILKENKVFSLSESAELPITIDSDIWKFLVAVCEGIPVWDILIRKCVSYSKGIEVLSKLLKANLIKEAQEGQKTVVKGSEVLKREAFVPHEKLDRVRTVLVETMGPMGEFLIEDTFEEMGLKELPLSMVDKFINQLLEKIPDTCLIDGEKCRDKLKRQLKEILKEESNGS